MDIVENLRESIRLLKEIEDYNDQLVGENGLISICDQKIDYWEHYLEFEKLVPGQVYRIAREMKRLRILRRKYKNDAELIRVYKANEMKMQNKGSRDILLVQIHKTDTRQKNAKYCYSAYTEEERNCILGIKESEDIDGKGEEEGIGSQDHT